MILDSRLVKKGDAEVVQVLLKWSNMSKSLATWEDKEDLKQQFQAAPAWGQAVSQDQGSVTCPSTKHIANPSTKYSGPEWVK
jgi:hypothetical protein